MDDDKDIIDERDRLRRIVAALWQPDAPNTDPDGRPLLGPADTQLAGDCIAWALGDYEPTAVDAEKFLADVFSHDDEAQLWRHIAYTMEATRDRAVTMRDCLLDVAAGAIVLLACVDEDNTHQVEANRVRQALQRYDRLRSS